MARIRTRSQLSGLSDLSAEVRALTAQKWNRSGNPLRKLTSEAVSNLITRDRSRATEWERWGTWLNRWEMEERLGEPLEAREARWAKPDAESFCAEIETDLKAERDATPRGR